MVTDRNDSLVSTTSEILKKFGKGSLMRYGDKSASFDIDVVPTGALSLDVALGLGGVPRGRVIEIYGPESSGKTTLALSIIAQAQKLGGIVGFIDAEHALDPTYAAALGVDIDEVLISQPDYGEQALEICDMLVKSNALDVVVVDSVAALVPKTEIDGEMGDVTVGLQARLMSQALRKLTGSLSRSNTICIFINQLREKIGVMFGSPETTTGGRALKFYSSVRLDVRRIETMKKDGEAVGNRVRVKVVKNKVASPFKVAEFDLIYGVGISSEGCILDLGVETGILQRTGAWYNYGETKLGQGRDAAKELLTKDPKLAAEIEDKVRIAKGLKPAAKSSGQTVHKSASIKSAPELESEKFNTQAQEANPTSVKSADEVVVAAVKKK